MNTYSIVLNLIPDAWTSITAVFLVSVLAFSGVTGLAAEPTSLGVAQANLSSTFVSVKNHILQLLFSKLTNLELVQDIL